MLALLHFLCLFTDFSKCFSHLLEPCHSSLKIFVHLKILIPFAAMVCQKYFDSLIYFIAFHSINHQARAYSLLFWFSRFFQQIHYTLLVDSVVFSVFLYYKMWFLQIILLLLLICQALADTACLVLPKFLKSLSFVFSKFLAFM